MPKWNNAPELEGVIEVARLSLLKTQLSFGLEEDLVSAAKSLGMRMWFAWLRYDPDALRIIEDFYGPEAAARAFEYMSETPGGFPKEPLKIPRQWPAGDKRKTPPEIRALWKICETAVQETFVGLLTAVEQKLVLNLSWAGHNAMFQKHTRYREKVKEMRRLSEGKNRRVSGGWPQVAGSIVWLASGSVLVPWERAVLP